MHISCIVLFEYRVRSPFIPFLFTYSTPFMCVRIFPCTLNLAASQHICRLACVHVFPFFGWHTYASRVHGGLSGSAGGLSAAQRGDLRNQPCSTLLPKASAKQDSTCRGQRQNGISPPPNPPLEPGPSITRWPHRALV